MDNIDGNYWEIIDSNGVIYSGTEDEMNKIWSILTNDFDESYSISKIRKLQHEYDVEWEGDIKLIEIHNRHR